MDRALTVADAPRTPSPTPAPWHRVLDAYLEQLASPRTREEYRRWITLYVEAIGDDPAAATPASVHAFAYAPGRSGRKPAASTVNVRLSALRGFYDFARRMGIMERNPTDDVKSSKMGDHVPKGLTGEELRRLLAIIPATPTGARDRALILTMVMTGLRRAEALRLRVGDLTRNGSVYYTARVKGGYERRRELPMPAWLAIEHSLALAGRPIETLTPEDRLFPISSQGFYQNLIRYARSAHLGHVTPHVLRHSAAKLRRETGSSIEDVSHLLGHRSISTTAIYLRKLEGEEDHGWGGVADALGVAHA